MLHLNKVHHIAIICSDYQRSLHFYTHILGLTVLAEHYRESRQSYKTDLALGDEYVVELFSFPSPPP
ncbi:MAG: VOC family protein, partial [Prevotella sp.]|nr:VOC family protein [Prevotella sp.]